MSIVSTPKILLIIRIETDLRTSSITMGRRRRRAISLEARRRLLLAKKLVLSITILLIIKSRQESLLRKNLLALLPLSPLISWDLAILLILIILTFKKIKRSILLLLI
jgi:hypothetical protein